MLDAKFSPPHIRFRGGATVFTIVKGPDGKQTILRDSKGSNESTDASNVYDTTATNQEVFEGLFPQGVVARDSVVVLYGQSGSGKSFTLAGSAAGADGHRSGILHALLRHHALMGRRVAVQVAFYHENKLFDAVRVQNEVKFSKNKRPTLAQYLKLVNTPAQHVKWEARNTSLQLIHAPASTPRRRGPASAPSTPARQLCPQRVHALPPSIAVTSATKVLGMLERIESEHEEELFERLEEVLATRAEDDTKLNQASSRMHMVVVVTAGPITNAFFDLCGSETIDEGTKGETPTILKDLLKIMDVVRSKKYRNSNPPLVSLLAALGAETPVTFLFTAATNPSRASGTGSTLELLRNFDSIRFSQVSPTDALQATIGASLARRRQMLTGVDPGWNDTDEDSISELRDWEEVKQDQVNDSGSDRLETGSQPEESAELDQSPVLETYPDHGGRLVELKDSAAEPMMTPKSDERAVCKDSTEPKESLGPDDDPDDRSEPEDEREQCSMPRCVLQDDLPSEMTLDDAQQAVSRRRTLADEFAAANFTPFRPGPSSTSVRWTDLSTPSPWSSPTPRRVLHWPTSSTPRRSVIRLDDGDETEKSFGLGSQFNINPRPSSPEIEEGIEATVDTTVASSLSTVPADPIADGKPVRVHNVPAPASGQVPVRHPGVDVEIAAILNPGAEGHEVEEPEVAEGCAEEEAAAGEAHEEQGPSVAEVVQAAATRGDQQELGRMTLPATPNMAHVGQPTADSTETIHTCVDPDAIDQRSAAEGSEHEEPLPIDRCGQEASTARRDEINESALGELPLSETEATSPSIVTTAEPAAGGMSEAGYPDAQALKALGDALAEVPWHRLWALLPIAVIFLALAWYALRSPTGSIDSGRARTVPESAMPQAPDPLSCPRDVAQCPAPGSGLGRYRWRPRSANDHADARIPDSDGTVHSMTPPSRGIRAAYAAIPAVLAAGLAASSKWLFLGAAGLVAHANHELTL